MFENKTDLQLIESVKNDKDSNALTLLVDKVTGLYISTITGYTYVPLFERQEMIDHKYANIYNFIEDYNPEKGMSFTTYVAQRTKWKCQSLINKYPEPEQIENIPPENEIFNSNFVENEDYKSFIYECAKHIDDKRFFEIFKMRNLPVKKTWVEIGNILGLSNEGARKIYNRNIENLKNKIIKE